jgi:hypothetical protein
MDTAGMNVPVTERLAIDLVTCPWRSSLSIQQALEPFFPLQCTIRFMRAFFILDSCC